MPVQNIDVAEAFNHMANLLEIRGANPFRVRAYRNAAHTITGLAGNLADMVKNGEDLTALSGIGEDLADKIVEMVRTGSMEQLGRLEKKMPASLDDLMRINGLGPQRIALLHEQLGIEGPDGLKAAAEAKRIRELKGFGKKTEAALLAEVRRMESAGEARTLLVTAEQRVEPLLSHLKEASGVERVEIAGSYRRRLETVGDLDILAVCGNRTTIMDRLLAFEDVIGVIARGQTKSSVRLRGDLQVDLRVVPQKSYGAALHYFTGSKAHNIAIRRIAAGKGLKINEYGVFRGDERIAGESETAVYAQVGLPLIEPELRENRGEIDAAKAGELPELITLSDIQGDLQAHSTETDGRASIRQMAEAARDLGYAYLAITDHSKRVAMAGGMDAERLVRQIDAVDRLNEEMAGIRILKGCEVDILKDGSLDLPDAVLNRLDLTVCAIHYDRDLSKTKQTERILRAMDSPHFTILAHPTGRIINKRPPYAIDLERIIRGARERGCILELNANPAHLDISDSQCRLAVESGVKLAISTDAHDTGELRSMRFGVDQARRGWVRAGDVVNTRSLADLQQVLRRR